MPYTRLNPTIGPGDYQSRAPPMRKTRNSLRMLVLLLYLGTDGTRIVSPERGMRKC
jgi:hypothetical protein